MASDLSLARRLQNLDHRIDGLTREIDSLPRHVAAIESALASHKEELAKAQSDLAENGKAHRSLEGQVGDFRQKISKLLDQMNVAKTNEQFRAFQHEIQFCKDKIDEIEESILEKMEQAEELQAKISQAEKDLRVESAKVAADVDKAKTRIAADQADREEVRASRAELAGQINPATLRVYDRIRKTRGAAVTPVTGESCGSCHVRLRPKFLQDLRQIESGVLTCESCGLIVYVPEPAEGDEPSDPSAVEAAQA